MSDAANSDGTAKKKLGRPFNKGQSGNPNGRPKVVEEFRSRCRRATDEHCIAMWEREVAQQGPDWVKCSELLAAYGHGRPSQTVSVQDEASKMSTDQLRAKIAILEAVQPDEAQ